MVQIRRGEALMEKPFLARYLELAATNTDDADGASSGPERIERCWLVDGDPSRSRGTTFTKAQSETTDDR